MIVQMLKNKEVLQDTFLLSNRYDNKSTDIKINLVDEFVNENYFYYLICKSPDKNVPQFAVPLTLDLETKSLTYLVRNTITNTKGNWEFCLLIKEIEIVDGIINDDGLIAISEHFVGKVKSGIITEEELGEQPLEEPLQIIYDILLATNANISANEEARQIFEPFDIGKSYVVGNKVSYLGSSYYCIADSSGILPIDISKWLLIAKKGDKGDKGNDGYTPVKGIDYFDGETGEQGIQGETGLTGKGLEFIWNGTQLGVRVEGDATYQYVNLKGEKGNQGDTGNGISSIVKTSGTGAAGTTDTYTITFTNDTTTTFEVYNGADGLGAGDMLKSIYDTNDDGKVNKADDADKFGGQQPAYYAKATDIPDISGKLDNSHNTDEEAHDDIRQSINTLEANKANKTELLEYEEGIWTPYLHESADIGNYSLQEGHYVVIGNVVTIFFRLESSFDYGSTTSQITLRGLPFSSMSNDNGVSFGDVRGIDINTNYDFSAYISTNRITFRFSNKGLSLSSSVMLTRNALSENGFAISGRATFLI